MPKYPAFGASRTGFDRLPGGDARRRSGERIAGRAALADVLDAVEEHQLRVLPASVAGTAVFRCDLLSGLKPRPRTKCDVDWTGASMGLRGRAGPTCAATRSTTGARRCSPTEHVDACRALVLVEAGRADVPRTATGTVFPVAPELARLLVRGRGRLARPHSMEPAGLEPATSATQSGALRTELSPPPRNRPQSRAELEVGRPPYACLLVVPGRSKSQPNPLGAQRTRRVGSGRRSRSAHSTQRGRRHRRDCTFADRSRPWFDGKSANGPRRCRRGVAPTCTEPGGTPYPIRTGDPSEGRRSPAGKHARPLAPPGR